MDFRSFGYLQTMRLILLCVFILILSPGLLSCKHDPYKAVTPLIPDNYPEAVSKIITTKCAVSGCHNAASYQISGGNLLMDTWEHLMDGGNTGAAVVPFSAECSPLLYFTNTIKEFGPIPPDNMKMPFNNPALSREEYLTLRNWIMQGAPDKNGNIPFASNAATRQKIYLAHQGCDYITVVDAAKNVVMRCIPTGKEVTIESAYSLKISPSGFAYISFWAGQHVLRMDTRTDSLVGEIDLGYPNSNVLLAASDNDLLLTNLFANSLFRIDVPSRQITQEYGSGSFVAPHGVAANKTHDTFFVTEQHGNIVYKIAQTGTIKKISIDGKPASTTSGPSPYQIVMAPDYSRYFISCQGSNEIRVMDAGEDTLIKIIPVGLKPQDIAISRTLPYLFVSCTDDPANISLFKGSVYVINYNSFEIVKIINDRYYIPHALAVDDVHKKLFVFSRNIDPEGPVPHHNSATCNGRNGYYSVFDFATLQPVNNRRYEVTIDPFAADVRFK
jgi:DNA-binding beta-propeller fold protein YncE